MALHKNVGAVDIHIIFAWSYANSAARLAATGFTAADVGKVAQQVDDASYWILANYSPIGWVNITSGDPSIHAALRQLIHFIDNGPAEDFASGAYREVTGTVFPTAIVWYDKAGAGKKKIVEELITWTGPKPTTVVWKMYDAAETLLVTLTDTITYSGVFETSRTRSIA